MDDVPVYRDPTFDAVCKAEACEKKHGEQPNIEAPYAGRRSLGPANLKYMGCGGGVLLDRGDV